MASIGFRWLDILEKEFDKAFVDLDLTVGELYIYFSNEIHTDLSIFNENYVFLKPCLFNNLFMA